MMEDAAGLDGYCPERRIHPSIQPSLFRWSQLTDDAVAESFHFFQLRAELQQKEIDTHFLEFADLILHLRRPADAYLEQDAVKHEVVGNGHLLLELGPLQ